MGRDSLQSKDRRVSRNQAEIIVNDKGVFLVPVCISQVFRGILFIEFQIGTNPVFRVVGNDLETYEENVEYKLHDGDVFQLVAEDLRYQVKITNVC